MHTFIMDSKYGKGLILLIKIGLFIAIKLRILVEHPILLVKIQMHMIKQNQSEVGNIDFEI